MEETISGNGGVAAASVLSVLQCEILAMFPLSRIMRNLLSVSFFFGVYRNRGCAIDLEPEIGHNKCNRKANEGDIRLRHKWLENFDSLFIRFADAGDIYKTLRYDP